MLEGWKNDNPSNREISFFDNTFKRQITYFTINLKLIMKNFLVFILLLSSLQGFSQKKGKVDPKEVAIDSLTQATVILTAQLDSTTESGRILSLQLDSVSNDLAKYKGMYTTIKEKVVLHDFDPAQTSQIIDSLKAGREATLSGLTTNSTALTDSITSLSKENTSLKATISSMEAAQADKEKIVAELKQLKELLDSKIITQEEYDIKKTKLMAKWQ